MVFILAMISLVGSLLLTPFLMMLLCVIFLASIGKSLGVRKMYIKVLLMLFEYGRANIETAQKKIRPVDTNDDDEDSLSVPPRELYCAQQPVNTALVLTETMFVNNAQPKVNGIRKGANGVKTATMNGNHLLNREDKLILVPEPARESSDALTVNCEVRNGNGGNGGNSEGDTVSVGGGSSDEETKSTDGKEKYKDFDLANCFDLMKSGMEAIIEDEVTSRFETEELKNWNILTRTNRRYEFVSWRLTVIWMSGFFIRYFFLLPLRVLICFIGIWWMITSTGFVGLIPDCRAKRLLNHFCYVVAFRIMSRSLVGIVHIYNKEHRPKLGGFCVANHTSPIDVLILSTDNSYSLIGQRHGGFLGILQRALARASPHIWFERSEVKDRNAVATKLREHVSNPNNPPILIFPEGTCINNTSVMQFKKGSFEVGGVIYPVAIKYDPRFGDAFWNSSRYSMIQYLYMMMTSWAIVCEVWYLPAMYRRDEESAIEFANRVKGVIAKQGGLVDLVWDGQLKRTKPKKEWRERQQEEFSKRLKCD